MKNFELHSHTTASDGDVDMDVMNEVFARIQETQMVMDATFENDDITGTITTKNNDQTIMTTIPFDKGW